MLLNLLIGPITTLIERLIPDKEKSDEAKTEMMQIMIQAQAKEIESKAQVVIAEVTGESKIQRTWRPHLMYLFMYIMAFNFIIAPTLGMFGLVVTTLEIPALMWGLLSVGVGGYIGSRGKEKVETIRAGVIDRQRYFDSLRNDYGALTPQQVAVFTKALERAENGK